MVAALAIDQPRVIAAAGRAIKQTHETKQQTKGKEDDLQSGS
jgi:hypothetical protein